MVDHSTPRARGQGVSVPILCCPLCGSEALTLLFMVDAQRVERCGSCSLVLLNPQPDCSDEQLYAEAYYRGDCAVKDRGQENVLEPDRVARRLESCRGVLEEIEGRLGRKGRLLDLGCGPGFLLKAAQDAGWVVAGADVSAFATAHARDRFGITQVTTGPLEDVEFPEASFDVVTLQHVIEHFRDPVRMVRRIKRWLAPGGLIWLETPDIDSGRARREGPQWSHMKVPEHLFYFNQRTLTRLLTGQGFTVLTAHREVEGTGLMQAACGGAERARRFYEGAKRVPGFCAMVKVVRSANEFFRAGLQGESEIIRLMARKA
ncbi:MAG: class I SAM-dependent methyltransferase [Nitrospirota bacterium]|nr:class I SAM-dependent methyltransferase [Nitrospirota bacterium]